jgi:predicted DsbA family dithiol-disulfide isomerase
MGQTLAEASTSIAQEGHSFVFKGVRERFLVDSDLLYQVTKNPMKIEIWSDIACPFCYIGKRKIEKAIQKLDDSSQVEVEWKSFQLNPDLVSDPSLSTLDYLSQSKDWSMEQTLQVTSQVVAMAKEEGLNFDFTQTVVANTKKAHRLLHLAKASGHQDQLKERLLKAYFSEGLNVDDTDTLLRLAEEVGLNKQSVEYTLHSEEYTDALEQDAYESKLIGVQGVPFFVFDRKFGISGAQPDEVFDRTLKQALDEVK